MYLHIYMHVNRHTCVHDLHRHVQVIYLLQHHPRIHTHTYTNIHIHTYIRDLRGNNMVVVYADAFSSLLSSVTINLKNNLITCVPEASATIQSDVPRCVSVGAYVCVCMYMYMYVYMTFRDMVVYRLSHTHIYMHVSMKSTCA